MTSIYLIRHGETEGESSIRFHGKTDVDLSDLGRRQMASVGSALAPVRFSRFVASSLSRSREGADLVRKAQVAPELAPIDVDSRLDEVDFGRFEGLTAEEIEATFPGDARQWKEQGARFHFPDGESGQTFSERVREAGAHLLSRARDTDDPMCVVVHKGVIRVLMAAWLDFEPHQARRVEVDLGGVFVFEWRGANPVARLLNWRPEPWLP